jgi:hypothetical protein
MLTPSSGRLTLAAALVAWAAALAVGTAQPPLTPSQVRNHPAIRYQQQAPTDAVARLSQRLAAGEITLSFDRENGYLRSVLEALRVPEDSQILVFSKTSFQARKINPGNPRALFHNDTVSVGWVRGGEVLELIAQDPRQGAIFYTLEQKAEGPPRLVRDLTCVGCHTWDATLNVPGMFLGSVFPAADGAVLYVPAFSVDHRTGFDLRWGGWYVTGRHSLPRHMGNALVSPGVELEEMVTPASVRVESLAGRFEPTGYPSPGSDIVSLMVLEHQARMLNLITRLGWETRLGPEAGRPLTDAVEELVDYLLFVDEEPLPGPIAGTSTFAKTFQAQGPRDSKGRSLRDLDLRTRLMRNPCSFLIYSPPFDALPDVAKAAVYARMWDVLSGAANDARYQRLTALDRQTVVEILRETKPDLPPYFEFTPVGSP